MDHPGWISPGKAIVVGVDGSRRNSAAVLWAAQHAEATGRPLMLVTVVHHAGSPSRGHHTATTADRVEDYLGLLSKQLATAHGNLPVSSHVASGPPARSLAAAADDQNLLVLGRRGLGTFSHALVGSTSTAAAGRSRVPVVVVPDLWRQEEHLTAPVVVGVDPDLGSDQTLLFAFNEAELRRTRLVVVHALDVEPLLMWDTALGSSTYQTWYRRAQQQTHALLAPMRTSFPAVSVRVLLEKGHPGDVLLAHAVEAQLLVLGRRREGHLGGGFAMGSASRGVLHYAQVPVAVIPAA